MLPAQVIFLLFHLFQRANISKNVSHATYFNTNVYFLWKSDAVLHVLRIILHITDNHNLFG